MICKTSRQELVELFKSLNIQHGDNIMLHSALFSLGIIEGGIEGFHEVLINTIGEDGTLIVPTFSYSFRKDNIFDINNTPSDKYLGVYPEYFRRQENVIRSSDPLFSMIAIGPLAKKLMTRRTNYCFGIGSIYESLFSQNIKFVCLGITYSTGLTAFMHIEKNASVPYRKNLELFGQSIDINGKIFNDSAVHFAKDEELFFKDAVTNREHVGSILEKKRISNSINSKYGKHFTIESKPFEECVLSLLKENPFLMYQIL
jgi:aminoglycoside 3-N-acetyltransferase